jgi:hypothetical protein
MRGQAMSQDNTETEAASKIDREAKPNTEGEAGSTIESEVESKIENEVDLAAGNGAKRTTESEPERSAEGVVKAKSGRPKRKVRLQPLKIPTSAEIQEVAADFQLATGPASVLDFVIKDTLADLRTYQRSRSRKIREDEQLTAHIAELHTYLSNLISFADSHPGILKEILPAPAGEKLGEAFSFADISKALGRDEFPKDGKLLRGHLRRKALPFEIASAEDYYARTREDYGLLHGDRLFRYALRVVHEPVEGWVAAKAANKGGRPANAERRYMIERLAKAAPHILGSDPPISIGGPFVELCERLLPLCGFAEDGIDKAVVSVLTRLRARRATGSEPSQA